MSEILYVVDAFASRPFSGNPAAVCILDAERADEWMQLVAREMNLSETAFLRPDRHGYHLRWFTPVAEVDLCGHATLASAFTLWYTGTIAKDDEARFNTRSGLLTCRRAGDWIEMDFPRTDPVEDTAPADLICALGGEPIAAGRIGTAKWLVELADADAVRNLHPDFGRIAAMSVHGVIVTATSDNASCDFVSRYFAPAVGVNEDPVTGSAHCALAPFWAARLGRTELLGYQASARGGFVRTALRGERVLLQGQAQMIGRVELIAG